jgi:hypothetical protein
MENELLRTKSLDVSSRRVDLRRRDVLRGLGLSAGGLLALGYPTGSSAAVTSLSITSGGVLLELDGGATWLRAVEGGNALAEVLTEQGTELLPNKRPGGVQYEEIVLTLALNVAPQLLSWINSSLTKGPAARNGVISYADQNYNQWKRLDFSNAVISEISFSGMDSSSTDGPQMTLRLAPAATRWAGGSGRNVAIPAVKGAKIARHFRLSIAGLEAATPSIRKIQGLGAKRIAPSSAATPIRSEWLANGGLDMQTIRLYVPESQAVPFYSWFENAVINGGGKTPDAERTGLLEWLATDLTTTVASANLAGLGIVRYAPVAFVPGVESYRDVEIDLYFEQMTLALPG